MQRPSRHARNGISRRGMIVHPSDATAVLADPDALNVVA
jgi:hypothetical protein